MKPFHSLLAAAIVAAIALPFNASGSDEGEGESPMHHDMERIERALKRVRRDAKDATKNESTLALVLEMQDATAKCKVMTPPLAEKKPEAERAAFVREYRKTLIGVEKDLRDLEIALLDGDQEKVQALIKKVGDTEDSGHEKFTEEG